MAASNDWSSPFGLKPHHLWLRVRPSHVVDEEENEIDGLFLGYQAGYNETGSNKLYIDNSSTSDPLIEGDFSSNTVTNLTDPARSVILKAATKNSSASSVQRGCNRIPSLGRNRFISESERYRFVMINDLSGMGGESLRIHTQRFRVTRRGEAFMC